MQFWQSIILGIVEGLTEFLPVSSTGHLILFSQWMKIPASDFLSSFEIYIQLGAILAVVALYFKRVINNFRLLKNLFIAFLPSVVVGLLFYGVIKHYLFDSPKIVAASLLIGGAVLIIFELFYKEQPTANELENISAKQALVIGLFQCLSVVPGVSRAAATIIGGLSAGIKRVAAVEFSFLLAVPTMLAATALDLFKTRADLDASQWWMIASGFIVSFIVAAAAVKLFTRFVKTRTFISFGIYRIAIAVVFWLLLLK